MKTKRAHLFAAIVCVLCIMALLPGTKARAASSGTMYVRVTQDYSLSQDMLKKINKTRKKRGLSSLKLDKALTSAAVQRAAESALHVSYTPPHRRPDGTLKRTLNKDIIYECNFYCSGGHLTKSDCSVAFSAWMNSPSHKAGILLSNARCVGIACTYVGPADMARTVWVLEFGSRAPGTRVTSKKRVSSSKKVKILNKFVKRGKIIIEDDLNDLSDSGNSISIIKGTKGKLYGSFASKDTFFPIPLMAKSFKWSSSKPSVVSVNSSGKITAKKKGTATITARLKNGTKKKASVKVKVLESTAELYGF